MLEIIYLHIPKTAGTSLLEWLGQHYAQEQIIPIKRNIFEQNPHRNPEEILLDLCTDKARVLHGHFTWQECRLVREKHPQALCLTFLRNPIDRVYSNYLYFQKRIRENKVNPEHLSRDKEGLLDYAHLPQSRNRMHTFLEGSHKKDFSFVGSFENFEQDTKALASALGLSFDRIPKANVNPLGAQKNPLNKEEIEIIGSLNQKDIALYRNWILAETPFIYSQKDEK
jgi:hypothetical protein